MNDKALTSNVMPRSTYDETEELLQQTRELREVANKSIERSDALIAAYRKLTHGQRSAKDTNLPGSSGDHAH